MAMMVAPSAGNVTLVSGELGDAAQQWAGLDDSLDDSEHPRRGPLGIIGDTVTFRKTPAIEQHHREHDDRGERGLADFLIAPKTSSGYASLPSSLSVNACCRNCTLGIREHERLAGLGSHNDVLDEGDRIPFETRERGWGEHVSHGCLTT